MQSDFKILLDMDGVLVDFMGSACRKLGHKNPYLQPESFGIWDTPKLLGIPPKDFWDACDDDRFWREMQWMCDGKEILSIAEKVVGRENIFLLTSPSRHGLCYKGKYEWVERNLPDFRTRLLMGPCKHLCASNRQILVDDADHNVEAFMGAGGRAVLVPRPWNRGYTISNESRLAVIEKLLWAETY